VIDGGKLLLVLRRLLPRLYLRGHGRNALLAHGGDFRRQGLASHASGAVVAGAIVCNIDGRIVDDDGVRYRAVVNRDAANVADVIDRAVVVEAISVPVTALIAHTDVAESVVNATVVADVASPEAVVVAVSSTISSPITGSPEQADFGWTRPCAGYPVVAFRRIAPVARSPNVAVARDVGLGIFRQRWRGLLRIKNRLAVTGILALVIVGGIAIGITAVMIAITVAAIAVATWLARLVTGDRLSGSGRSIAGRG
jgi:hypothetical protein